MLSQNLDPIISQLRNHLRDVFAVDSVTISQRQPESITFRGRLMTDSDFAFATVRPRFETLGYTPTLTRANGQDVFTALPGLVRVRESNPWINLILFLLTIVTTVISGGSTLSENCRAIFRLDEGVLFSASLLLILGAHELGHYFVARYYHAPVTLPYFIPVPPGFGLGTLGAVIRLKAPFVNRKSLFDVGIAGPLAGLVFAVPLLFIGLSLSKVMPPTCPNQTIQEGNSIVYAVAKLIVYGKFLPSNGEDVILSPVAFAAWIGLFVTALNLLPAGQLDGGHVAFALLGRRARLLGTLTVILLAALALPVLLPAPLDLSFLIRGLRYPGYVGWFVWVAFIYLTGLSHPIPLNSISDLGTGRQLLGVFSWLLFVVLFTPLPFSQ